MNREEQFKEDVLAREIKVALFGLGHIYKTNKYKLQHLNIIALLDNDREKQGTVIDGIRVISPCDLCKNDVDYIIVMSSYIDEIEKQLYELGYRADQIVSYKDIDFLNYCMENRTGKKRWYLEHTENNKKISGKKIVLLSSEMTLTGAAVVLFYAAKLLKKNGFTVMVISIKPDKLEAYYAREQIEVSYDAYLKSYNDELWFFLNSFDYVLVNTMVLQDMLLRVRKLDNKCIWWIHESGNRCDSLKNQRLIDSFSPNLDIYAVGKCALDTLHNLWGNIEVKNLLYGIPDEGQARRENKEAKSKLIFAIIGSIYDVKAQDIFLRAIVSLPMEIRKQAEFWIIGKVLNQTMYDQMGPIIEANEDIHYLGELTREEIKRIYEAIDVLVCPSRRDTLPVVTMEAMMNYKPCIVSNVVGTAYYIEDGVNGFICETENVDSLAKKMTEAINRRNELDQIGNRARKIYSSEFSLDVFEKQLLKIFI